jgi:hypothetical protein
MATAWHALLDVHGSESRKIFGKIFKKIFQKNFPKILRVRGCIALSGGEFFSYLFSLSGGGRAIVWLRVQFFGDH